jgi:type II secretory ATPase GspE/PulE/Tfp pilus assembly ATPase PilB-like protein
VDTVLQTRNQAGAAQVIGHDFAFRYLVLPVDLQGEVVLVDAVRRDGLHELEALIRRRIVVERLRPADDIRLALRQVFRASDAGYAVQVNEQREESTKALVTALLEQAVLEHASDVHVEPHADGGRVRLRVDRSLRVVRTLTREEYQSLVSVLKHLSALRIDATRIFQDGSFSRETANGRRVDCRVSSIPTTDGEKLVLRLLGSAATLRTYDRLGLPPSLRARYDAALAGPAGVHIVAGPTGMGKTTTVFALLSRLDPSTNICTVEDPVEIRRTGAYQIEVNAHHDVTFPSALRAFARQDPDVIVCGEMRDAETAVETMKAGLSGRTMYSTIHAADAIRVVDRLVEFGVRRATIGSALRSVLAQRLVRKLCSQCRLQVDLARPLREAFAEQFAGVRRVAQRSPRGCASCLHTGVTGQVAVFEVFTMSDQLEEAIVGQASRSELLSMATAQGYRPMREHAAALIAAEITSVEEACEVLPLTGLEGR